MKPFAAICAFVASTITAQPLPAGTPVLNVSIVSHNEEGGPRQVDYGNPGVYTRNRELVRQLATMISAKGAKYNLQSDWSFLQAVARFDTGTAVANTNGKNILRWLVEDLGFEADPHAHESRYNYADVAYLHQQLGLTPSRVVGGFLYSPADNPQGWEQHEAGIFGRAYPSYFWRADTLWGAATAQHQGEDDETYGVWRPRDKNNFTQHSESRRLVYIGGGCKSNVSSGTSEGLDAFIAAFNKGALSEARFYTATIMINQGSLNTAVITNLAALLDRLQPYAAAGAIRYRGLTEVYRLWLTGYGAQPSRTTCAEMEALGR